MSKAPDRRALHIHRPPLAQSRADVLRVTLIAATCFAAGVGAVVWNAGGKRLIAHDDAHDADRAAGGGADASGDDAPHTPQREPDDGDAPDAPRAQTTDAAAAEAAAPAFVVAEGDAGAALALATDEAIDAGVPSATPFSGARRVEPGRVAYLRCEGVPQQPGPYPCPRDEALETAVWAVLDTLPRCAEAPAGLGESDVRLELVAGAPTDVKLRAPRPGVPRLDGPAILRCAAGPLSHVATSTRATKLVLSFRFALVDAAQPRAR